VVEEGEVKVSANEWRREDKRREGEAERSVERRESTVCLIFLGIFTY